MKAVHVKCLIVGSLVLTAGAAFAASGGSTIPPAANTGAIDSAMHSFETASKAINTKLVTIATQTLAAALALQWVLTFFKEIFSGDMTSNIAKIAGLVTWFGAGLYLIQHSEFLSDAFVGYVKLAAGLSNLSATDFTPSGIVSTGTGMIGAVNKALVKAVGGNWLAIGDNFLAALYTVLIDLLILMCFFTIALSLFVATLEFWMMAAVAPLAFAMIPLSSFRDQGMAPIKGAISMGLRILILGVVISVSKEITTSTTTAIASFTLPKDTSALDGFAALLAGLFGCALMAIQSGKIASAIASGSASFSGSDAIRGGMAMAGAAGVATAAAAGIGGSALGAVKAAANPAGKATGHAMNALSAAQDFLGGGKASVSPVGGGGGAGAGSKANGGWGNFGGSAIEPRPSPGSDTSSGSKSSSSGAGDAGTASIGGAGPSSPAPQSGGSSALQKLGSATHGASEALAQDNASVGVQMHVGKD